MNRQSGRPAFAFDSPDAAIAALVDRLAPVGSEAVPLSDATGRVLAEPIRADRPSPACDVSAMDGYAVRLDDLAADSLPVAGEVCLGAAPPEMPKQAALRIFTGGPAPAGCEAVIPREQVEERAESIGLPRGLAVKPGQHIRRGGENAPAGQVVLEAGRSISPAAAAALAAFGAGRPRVHRRLRVTALVTGNEVREVGQSVEPWQLRDSNGPALAAMVAPLPWVDWQGVIHVDDDAARMRAAVHDALDASDVLLLTGGVSMGDYDFVPAVLREAGCAVVFHKLPIRPGKPILGAVGPGGQAVLGLSGNPVSVMATARRFAASAMRRLAGFTDPAPPPLLVRLLNPDEKRLALHWSRPVGLRVEGEAELLSTHGSGDLVSTAASDGFVEIPPNQAGPGPWPFYPWSVQP